jgi:hypothetical protein
MVTVFATIDHALVAVILAIVVALTAFAGAPVNVTVGVSLLG